MSDGLTNGNIKAAALWRMIAGIFGAILLGMLAFFGNALLGDVAELGERIADLRSEIAETRNNVSNIRGDIGRLEGNVAAVGDRLDRANARQTDQERRLLRTESKLGLPLP